MIETWGTEIAMVIAVLGTGLINVLFLKSDATKYPSIKMLLGVCNVFTIVAVLLYGYLITKGVNL